MTSLVKHQFSNLVFEGGGVLGAAEVGAYNTLYQSGYLNNVQSVVGTSAGSILATCLAFGATPKQLKDIVFSCPFLSFKDLYPGLVSWRFLTRFGVFKGNKFTQWMMSVIDNLQMNNASAGTLAGTLAKDITFRQLEQYSMQTSLPRPNGHGYKYLSIIAYNLDRGQPLVFNHEYSPDTRIIDAVRASIAIPGFFAGVNMFVDSVSYFTVDGGVSANYPIRYFDFVSPNQYTLGIRVDSASDRRKFRFTKPMRRYCGRFLSPIEVVSRLTAALFHKANGAHLDPPDWNRTVFVDSLGINATNFDISPQEVRALYESGIEGAAKYISWLESISPLNPIQVIQKGA